MGISNSAIIVIVLVACLAVTALGASLFKHYKPADGEVPYSPGYEQKLYMAEVRARGFENLKRISWAARDLESRCMFFADLLISPLTDLDPAGYYRPTNTEDSNKDTGSS